MPANLHLPSPSMILTATVATAVASRFVVRNAMDVVVSDLTRAGIDPI